MLVLYAYDAETPEELTIHENDVVTVITEAPPSPLPSPLFALFFVFVFLFKYSNLNSINS
jgi:hypothetical protein